MPVDHSGPDSIHGHVWNSPANEQFTCTQVRDYAVSEDLLFGFEFGAV